MENNKLINLLCGIINYNNKIVYYIIVVFFSIIGFLLLENYYDKFGPGISYDSIFYITGSENIFEQGKFIDMYGNYINNWPPLYSIIMLIFKPFNLQPTEAAGLVNSTVYAFTIFLSGFIIYKITCNSFWLSIIALGFILVSISLFDVYRMAWSEPTFLFFTLLSLVFISKSINSNSLKDWLLSSLFVSLAILTRYHGVLLIFIGCFSIFIFNRKKIKQFLIKSLYFNSVVFVVFGSWVLRNYLHTHDTFNRRIIFHQIHLTDFSYFFKTVACWFAPSYSFFNIPMDFTIVIMYIVCVVFLIFAFPLIKSIANKSHNAEPLPFVFFFFIVFYFLSLILYKVLIYNFASIVFDLRFVFPLFIPFLVICLYIIKSGLSGLHSFFRTLILILVSVFFYYHFNSFELNLICQQGAAYDHPKFRQSELISVVEKIPDRYTILSNEPEALFFYSGRKILNFNHYNLEDSLLNYSSVQTFLFSNEEYKKTFMHYNVEKIDLNISVYVFFTNLEIPFLNERVAKTCDINYKVFEDKSGYIICNLECYNSLKNSFNL